MKPTVIAGVLVVVFVLLIGAVTWTLLQKPNPPGPRGTVDVFVGVSPTNSAWTHVNATFDLVQVHEATGNNTTGWVSVSLANGLTSDTVDLKSLSNTTLEVMSSADLPAGNYSGLSLRISGTVRGTLVNGTVVYMNVVGPTLVVAAPFTVNASKTTGLSVLIDLQASIVASATGLTWYFHPVATAKTGLPK